MTTPAVKDVTSPKTREDFVRKMFDMLPEGNFCEEEFSVSANLAVTKTYNDQRGIVLKVTSIGTSYQEVVGTLTGNMHSPPIHCSRFFIKDKLRQHVVSNLPSVSADESGLDPVVATLNQECPIEHFCYICETIIMNDTGNNVFERNEARPGDKGPFRIIRKYGAISINSFKETILKKIFDAMVEETKPTPSILAKQKAWFNECQIFISIQDSILSNISTPIDILRRILTLSFISSGVSPYVLTLPTNANYKYVSDQKFVYIMVNLSIYRCDVVLVETASHAEIAFGYDSIPVGENSKDYFLTQILEPFKVVHNGGMGNSIYICHAREALVALRKKRQVTFDKFEGIDTTMDDIHALRDENTALRKDASVLIEEIKFLKEESKKSRIEYMREKAKLDKEVTESKLKFGNEKAFIETAGSNTANTLKIIGATIGVVGAIAAVTVKLTANKSITTVAAAGIIDWLTVSSVTSAGLLSPGISSIAAVSAVIAAGALIAITYVSDIVGYVKYHFTSFIDYILY